MELPISRSYGTKGRHWSVVALAVVLVCIVCDFVRCEDLSTTCPKYNELLQGHTFLNHSEWSPLACAGMCTRSTACQSYSFCPAQQQCHLHDATQLQYPNDMVQSEGCTHYKMTRQPRNSQWESTSTNVACNPYIYKYRTQGQGRHIYNKVFPNFNPYNEIFLVFFSLRCTDLADIYIGHGTGNNYYEIRLGARKVPVYTLYRGSTFIKYGRMPSPFSDTHYRHYWLAYVDGNILLGNRGAGPFIDFRESRRFRPTWLAITSEGVACDWAFHSMANLQMCRVCSGF